MMAPRKDLRSNAQPRRSSRLQVVAAAPVAGPRVDPASGRVTKLKPQPRPKPQQKTYDCTTCGDTLAASSFPKHLPTDKCDHLINTCRPCLTQWIAVQMDNTTYDNISCPECPELMHNSDVKLHAAKDVYKRFDELERRAAAEKTPGWRWCLAPSCKAGQVHEPSIQASTKKERPRSVLTRKGKKEQEQKLCVCNECGAKACVECDRPYHEDETCEEYQERMKDTDAASAKTIKRDSKQCPGCTINITRNGGCDAMRCTKCKTHFCFLCLRTYDTIRQDGHGPRCVYARPGAVDPHLIGPGPVFAAGAVVLGLAGAAFLRR